MSFINDKHKWQDLLLMVLNEFGTASDRDVPHLSLLKPPSIGLSDQLINELIMAGFKFPSSFPTDIDFDYEMLRDLNEDEFNTKWKILTEYNKYSSFFFHTIYLMTLRFKYFAAFIGGFDGLSDTFKESDDLYTRLYAITLAQRGYDLKLLNGWNQYQTMVHKEAEQWLSLYCLELQTLGQHQRVNVTKLYTEDAIELASYVEFIQQVEENGPLLDYDENDANAFTSNGFNISPELSINHLIHITDEEESGDKLIHFIDSTMVRICYASKLPFDYFDLKEDQPLFIKRLTEKLNLALAWHGNELAKGVKIKPELVPVFEMLSDLEYEI